MFFLSKFFIYFADVKILSIQALRGINFWSHKVPRLILVRVEISNAFNTGVAIKKVAQNFPELAVDTQVFSPEIMAKTIALLALELQKQAGIDVHYSDSKTTKFPGTYNVVFEYKTEKAGKFALESAVKIIHALKENLTVSIVSEIEELKAVYENEQPASVISSMIKDAKTKGIPVIAASGRRPWQIGYGKYGIEINENTIAPDLSADNKLRIPLIAITGSNGKTTTTRLIAHIIKEAGKSVGYTTSDGIYINDEMVDEGDTTGPLSAEMVLRNKTVEVAVLETARGGIVRAGLGFDQCDIAVITNVQEDHLGISDIETIEDLTKVKGVVLGAVKVGGIAVLNADNANTVGLGQHAKSEVAWFSMDLNNPLIQSAEKACYLNNGCVYLKNSSEITKVAEVKDIPVTFGGRVGFMVQNALAATLAAWLFGIEISAIAKSLATFKPSSEQTPGRMNIFEIGNKKLLVDFAHNPDGFAGIRDFLATIDSPCKIGIIVGTGDRKESDLIELGKLSAQMLDRIIIQQVKFLRGRTAEEIVSCLATGITAQNKNNRLIRNRFNTMKIFQLTRINPYKIDYLTSVF